MKLASFLGMIPGFDVRTKKIGTTTATSITGSAKAIAYGLQLALFVGLVSIDQVTRFGVRKDGKQAHLVLTEDPKHQFSKAEESQLALLDGYDYAHQVTAMDQGVNVAVFDKGFEPNAQTGKAFGHFAAAIYEKGKIRGTDTNTMILLGRSSQDRVLVTCQWGKQNPLTSISQTLEGDVRYASCKDTTLLAAKYGTGQIAALHVDEIVAMFESAKVPNWQKQLVAGAQIEDITPSIGNTPTVVLTATIDDKRQLIPANVGWNENEKGAARTFSLELVKSYATDMPKSKGPVVRLSPTTITMVNSNGTDAPRLAIEGIDQFGDKDNVRSLRRMATDASSGKISEYRAAA